MVGRIRTIIEKYAASQYALDVNGELCEKEYIEADNWLKFLKQRYTWKPSDDQMKALADALNLAKNCGEECAFDLRTLYEQLEKLKE